MFSNLLWRLTLLIAASLGVAVVATLVAFNQFEPVPAGGDARCVPVRGIVGASDLQVDRRRRRVFIASRAPRAEGPARGGIFAVSIDDPLDEAAWRDRTGGVPEAFEPVGLGFYDDGETRRLFVVNAATNAVEIYDVDGRGDLKHVRAVRDRRLTSPNDVAAVAADAFYVANDVDAGRRSVLGRAQFLARARAGKLFFFDGVAWRIAAEGLRYAEGVAVSAAGETVYAGETAGLALSVFSRAPRTNHLSFERAVPLPGGVESVNVDGTGAVFITASPKPLRAKFGPAEGAPSLVLRLSDGPDGREIVTPVFRDDGGELAAATASDAIGTKVIVGALAEDRFLICDAISTVY
ncbi:MAG: hypothetical protein ACFB00_05440 [Parvularculaceae bacterium]